MAKAILEFDLDEPGDVDFHKRCIKSLDLVLVLDEIDKYLRTQLKYNEDGLTQEAYDALEKAREEFYRLLNERNISLDELVY